MIYDIGHVFSDNQDVHSDGTTVNSTNDIDIGVANPNMGAGNKKVVRVDVSVDFAGGTSIKATLYESSDDSTYTVLLDSVAVLTAAAIIGKRLAEFVLPAVHKRYLRVVYTCVGTMTEGNCNAWLDITP